MRFPRFPLWALMIAVAVVGLGLAALAALDAHWRAEAEAGMVLQTNYWITVSISPLGWVVLGGGAVVTVGAVAAIVWALREG